jgi:hypothetical protein
VLRHGFRRRKRVDKGDKLFYADALCSTSYTILSSKMLISGTCIKHLYNFNQCLYFQTRIDAQNKEYGSTLIIMAMLNIGLLPLYESGFNIEFFLK